MSSRITAVVNRMPLRRLALATALCVPAFASAQTPVDPKHLNLLDEYCVACHNQEDFSGGIS